MLNKQCGQHIYCRGGIWFHTSKVLFTNMLVRYHLVIKTVTNDAENVTSEI